METIDLSTPLRPAPWAGCKYRIVLSRSECPNHDCSVRRSTPFRSAFVAKVVLNLCSQKLLRFNPAFFPFRFKARIMCVSGLPVLVLNTRASECTLDIGRVF